MKPGGARKSNYLRYSVNKDFKVVWNKRGNLGTSLNDFLCAYTKHTITLFWPKMTNQEVVEA